MAIKRRKNKLQDLAASGIITNRVSGSIPFEYNGPNSPLFTISEIPNPAPQGKSSFLISGTELLKNGVEVKIEIIDNEGGVIYTEAVSNYIEGNARRVSIEVYDDTPAGPANLYILAQVDPDEWEDETGTDVRNYPNPSPPKNKGIKRKKKRRKDREKRKQMQGMPRFDFTIGGGGRFFIPSPFAPPPSNDTRFRRRGRRRRQRGRTSDISDQYNFIQKVEMQIVPTATNTEKILFYQEPRIKVFETFKPFVANLAQTGSISLSGSLAGQVINDTQAAGATSALDSFGATLGAFRRKRKFKKFAGKGGLSKRKRITRRASPEVDNYSFTSDSFSFGSQFVGAKINLNNPTVNSTLYPPSRYSIPTTGSFEVIKVKNSSTIIPDKPFRIRDNQLQQIVDAPITDASFSIEFAPEATQSISITNFRSYADVRVANIRTFSGDVFRTKIYRKSEESIGDYEVFADLPLESSELLLNTHEGTGLERTGYFIGQEDINKYWEVSQSAAGVTGAPSASVMAYDIDKQMDSMYISGSTLEVNQSVEVKLKKTYAFTLEENVNYDFTAELYGITTPKVLQTETGGTETKSVAELEVYLSGSNIPAQQGSEAFGAKLGVLRISENETEKDFKVTTGDFESTAKSENCILILKVNSGKWYVSDISIRPATETGFSPDLFTFQAPMPANEQRPETYEFIAEFYDVNNNQADAFAFTTSGSVFQGSNMVITGGDNVLESNLFIGGESTSSGMHLGGVSSTIPETGGAGAAGSGFMRSVGYTGFTSASSDALAGKPGFMIYSGSVLPDSGDEYDGVGLELIGESGSLRFSTKPSRFEVQADAFFVGNQELQFISGAVGNIEISSSNFHLSRAGDVTMQGTITADAGNIGGFTIFGSPQTPAIASPDKSLILSGSGQITGSQVLFTGGRIANWDINGDKIQSINASDKGIFLDADASTPIIEIRENDDNRLQLYHTSNSDWGIVGKQGGNNIFRFGDTNKIAAWTFDDKRLSAFKTSTADKFGVSIDADYQLITFHGDAGAGKNNVGDNDRDNVMLAVGQLTDDIFGIKGWNTAGNRVFEISPTRNEIAGWTISDSTLQGGNLILDKDGSLRSSNYVSDFSGWKISAENNGFAEFENVKVRGTLSTTTFEKESVNAVGGQLFVANSTALTGSTALAAHTTMSVENASGFASGEILVAKKVTNTGFTTEYIKVDSASLDGDLSKDELYGRIYVTRSISSTSTVSGSVGDPPGTAQDYEPGQVVASTGRIGTGYIRINANPNDPATPYIDIVERTGSAPYDVELKARLGDLSGAAGTRNVPAGFTGFGLMSEVAFLSGSNIKLEAPAFILGDLNKNFVSGAASNIEISSSAFHLQRDGKLLFGSKTDNKYIEWDNSNLTVRGDLTVDNIRTPAQIGGSPSTLSNASASITSDGFAKFTSASIAGFDISPTAISASGLLLNASGEITGAAVQFTGGDIAGWDIGASTLSKNSVTLDSANRLIDVGNDSDFRVRLKENSGEPFISIGNPSDTFGDKGIFLQAKESAGDTRIMFSVVSDPSLGAGRGVLSLDSNGNLNISSSNFEVKSDGTVEVKGDIQTAATGQRVHLDSADNQLKFITAGAGTVLTIGTEIFGFSGSPDGLRLQYGARLNAFSVTNSNGVDSNEGQPLIRATHRIGQGGNGQLGTTERQSIFGQHSVDFYNTTADDNSSTAKISGVKGQVSIGGHEAQAGAKDWSPRSFGVYGSLYYSGDGSSDINLVGGTTHSAGYFEVVKDGAVTNTTDGNFWAGYFVGGDVKIESGRNLHTAAIRPVGDGTSMTGRGAVGTAVGRSFDDGGTEVNTPFPNTFTVWHPGSDRDNGLMIVRDDGGVTSGNWLGGIGFDSGDGNVPSSVLEAGAYIGAYAAESHGDGDKGANMVFGTAHIDMNHNTVANERMRLSSQGPLLIGRTAIAATSKDPLVEIDGYISFDGFLERAGTGGDDNGGNLFNFHWDGSTGTCYVDTTAMTPTFSVSDYRIKENVNNITGSFNEVSSSLHKINQLRPITYTQKSCSIFTQKDDVRPSFIAHEIQEQFPYIVKGTKDEVDDDGTVVPQQFDIPGLTTYLVKAVQELTQAHNDLISQITNSTDLNQLKSAVTGSIIKT